MLSYTPPLKDMRFVLERVLDAPEALAGMPAYAEVDADLMRQVCEEAGRFAAGVLFPLNAAGDREGCRYERGAVRTPAGYADAYRQFVDAGWPALACAPEHGGQGLPQVLNCVLNEMTSAANHGWSMYPGLAHGAYACLARYGSAALKERYLPKIVSGEWLATMCLTEAQAGSDLGLLRTRATPIGDAADGAYAITGGKIFISGGEQDMSANIVHLVLARLPDAPPGSKGVSLFLVPKWLPDGARNAVHCTGIEHKMGIRGSATCAMEFEGATGWLVGEPHRGLAAMFVMMNAARLQVGAQGLGIAETAWQNAQAYALERVQSKAAGRPESRRGEAADPIAMHAPVQRLLMTQRAWVEGGRMLAYWTALALDGAERHPDRAVRDELHGQVELITPVVKAMLTAQGYEGASQALQVFGGHGYISETGIEQYVRDARVTMIYEGTNEIQAVDLLLRKVLADGGARLEGLLARVLSTAEAECDGEDDGAHGALAPHARALCALVRRLRGAVRAIARAAEGQAALPHRVAPETLRLVGHCALAWLWLRAARAAIEAREEDPAFHDAKRATASYYFTYVLPEVEQLFGVVDGCLNQAPEDAVCFSV
ncbi:acyl-CoA dehydrogenase [Pseudoduganella namucuonensis]|uniref:Acyl-CoA dehydrogenase n=1 Tax=Pseudoduganella namucuonensis TaxID=1035707 RepID=A0A1I7L831_9BURK|nr:acyl-CoA dehydrogenase [Pseudoduganella namucuonensis]SFV05696.1 Acyl-CoA dehydrogenase [Pseudoduganella namucuonensis]